MVSERKLHHYHLRQFDPSSGWPEGGWSLYRITGDEIARRCRLDSKGEIVERHSWPGYIGCFETLGDVMHAIARQP